MKWIVIVYWLGIAPAQVPVEAPTVEDAYRIVCLMPVASRTPTAMATKTQDVPADTRYAPCFNVQKK